MKKLSSLSIFFPAYNDEKTIDSLVKEAYKIAPLVTKDFEISVVNDGSRDKTLKVLQTLKSRFPKLKIINHENNLGYGAALTSGFENATKDWIFYTDGDGQYDPKELLSLVEKVDTKTDVVNGYKVTRSDPAIRKIAGSLWNWLLQAMYHLPIHDVDCDFRLIKRTFFRRVLLTSTSGIICLELILKLKKAGASFAEVPVRHHKRPFGDSTFFTFGNILKTLYDNLIFYKKWRNG